MVKGWVIIYGIDDSFRNALFRTSSPLPYLPYFACGRINLECSRTGSRKHWKEAHNAICFLFSLPFFRSFNMKCDCRRKTKWRRIYTQVSGCSFIAEDRKPLPKSLSPGNSVRKVTFAKRNTGFRSFRNAILSMQLRIRITTGPNKFK